MVELISLLASLGTVGVVWMWVCFLFATVGVADAKGRNGLLAFCAYVVAGPAAVFYYLAVPTKAVEIAEQRNRVDPTYARAAAAKAARQPDTVGRFIASGEAKH